MDQYTQLYHALVTSTLQKGSACNEREVNHIYKTLHDCTTSLLTGDHSHVVTFLEETKQFVSQVRTTILQNSSLYANLLGAIRTHGNLSNNNTSTTVFHSSLVNYEYSIRPAEQTAPESELCAIKKSLKDVYGSVVIALSPLVDAEGHKNQSNLQDYTRTWRWQCFSILLQLEFCRELVLGPGELMHRLVVYVEELIELDPNPIISALSSIVLNQPPPETIPKELNILWGWSVLTIGLIFQRKLRVVLLRASPSARNDVVAVVFEGLYHGVKSVDTFSHQFLGFCLTSLSQFIPSNTLIPYYLDRTLDVIRILSNKDRIIKPIATIFGGLVHRSQSNPMDLQSRKMIRWGLRKITTTIKALVLPVETSKENKIVGLYLTELYFEVAKTVPVDMLPSVAMDIEHFIQACRDDQSLLQDLMHLLFQAISQHCEEEKSAWLAAWYIGMIEHYETSIVNNTSTTSTRARL